jgi:hypothetical protein
MELSNVLYTPQPSGMPTRSQANKIRAGEDLLELSDILCAPLFCSPSYLSRLFARPRLTRSSFSICKPMLLGYGPDQQIRDKSNYQQPGHDV